MTEEDAIEEGLTPLSWRQKHGRAYVPFCLYEGGWITIKRLYRLTGMGEDTLRRNALSGRIGPVRTKPLRVTVEGFGRWMYCTWRHCTASRSGRVWTDGELAAVWRGEIPPGRTEMATRVMRCRLSKADTPRRTG